MNTQHNPAPKQTVSVSSKTGTRKKHRHSRTVRTIALTFSVILTIVGTLSMCAGIYIWQLLDLVVYDGEESQVFVDSLPEESDDVASDTVKITKVSANANVNDIAVPANSKNITNIMLIGVDSRSNSYSSTRSDTNIILSINKKAKTIKMVSLLRDTLVTIPGRDRDGDGMDDYAKLNAAYAYGGFSLLSKTLEQNFRIKIDQYITVNFVAFPLAVDAIGGLDFDITKSEAGQVPALGILETVDSKIFKPIGTSAGSYHMDGFQTLQYARIRHIDSDFSRTERQRKVVSALLAKAKTMNIGTLNSVLKSVLPQIQTNMSPSELSGYAANSLSYSSYTIENGYHIPEDKAYTGVSISGLGSCLQLTDPRTTVVNLQEYIYQ